MPIEFRCTECQKLLRTGDDTAGKQAKCPECGGLMTVPSVSETPREVPPEVPPAAPPETPGSPFSATGPEPSAVGDPENPYQAPTQYGPAEQMPFGISEAYASSRVAGPAIALIVTGALGIAIQVANFASVFLQIGMMGGGRGAMQPFPIAMPVGIMGVQYAVSFILGIVVILGAIKMKNLQSYGFAMAASIIAMIPCISPCCFLGLPFGIWALVVLCDDQVKAAFRG